jgi:hypothetical protein
MAYGTIIAIIKFSILFLYYRVFPTRFMQRATFVLGGIVMAWWLAVVLVSIFQCDPVDKVWKPFMQRGHCINKNPYFLGNAIPNIITDVMILFLPVHQLWGLQIKLPQKIAVLGIFMLGSLLVPLLFV